MLDELLAEYQSLGIADLVKPTSLNGRRGRSRLRRETKELDSEVTGSTRRGRVRRGRCEDGNEEGATDTELFRWPWGRSVWPTHAPPLCSLSTRIEHYQVLFPITRRSFGRVCSSIPAVCFAMLKGTGLHRYDRVLSIRVSVSMV